MDKTLIYKNNRIKTPTTFQEQVDILKSRNLRIENKEEAISILSRINYYRLSAYMLTLKNDDKFEEDISFDTIYEIYEFDKKLRNMLMGVLETIEITFRSQISYLIAHKYGAIGHMDAKNFENKYFHKNMIGDMDREIARSKEIFVQHHMREYEGVFPVWVSVEVISFNVLSKMYSNLKNEDKSKISKGIYKVPYIYLRNWLHALTMIRNTCAHYGRIYNKKLAIKIKLDKDTKQNGLKNDEIFTAIYIIGKLIKDKEEWNIIINELEKLIDKYKNVDIKLMGFPGNWKEMLRKI